MTILPLDPVAHASSEALVRFLAECRDAAAQAGRPRLVSITIQVESLDPLAVLESIFEPGERHFYAERPSEGWAIAGAESVLSFSTSGSRRFEECQRFIDGALGDTIAVGDQEVAFGGPHFLAAFAFLDCVAADEPFGAACVFVPRWQVAHRDGRTTAVANLLVDAEAPVEALGARVWRAHSSLGRSTSRSPEPPDGRSGLSSVSEVGGQRSYESAVSRAVARISRGESRRSSSPARRMSGRLRRWTPSAC